LSIRTKSNRLLGFFAISLAIVSGISASGQINDTGFSPDDFDTSLRSHPSVRSEDRSLRPDTTLPIIFPGLGKGFWNRNDEVGKRIAVLPVFAFEGGVEAGDKGIYRTSAGIALRSQFGKFAFRGSVIGGGLRQPGYLREFTDSLGIVPSLGRNLATEGTAFLFPSAALSFSPNEIFTFDLGFGKHFFGSGHRSMFLSDVAYNYPYLRIDTEVWHIRYTNVFAWQKDIRIDPTDPGTFRDKFSSTHYLSWAISPRFNVGLFETIVWQGQDTLSNRGFDPNYLNPIIFFRPVEFSIGSPDNAIIGLDLTYKLDRHWLLYGQLVFDEFLLSEFRARDGWWGNKWGAQLGAKAVDPFGFSESFLRAEFNVARPFTYTHGSVLQNFGHYNQPLAHVLGTNFYEGILQMYSETGPFFFDAQWVYAVYGRDRDSLNLGGDIYRSYADPAEIYGNEIAQGERHTLFYQRLTAGMILNRKMNLRLSAYYIYRRLDRQGGLLNNDHILGVRLATELFREYTDF